MLSSNGRPGALQGIRTPHQGAALPVDAYSLAVSCGGRGVSRDIWPASLSAPAAPRAARFRRARPGSLPVTRDTSRHDLITAETPERSPAARSPAPLGSQAVGGASPSARYRERDARCLCDASTAYCCATAAEAHGAPDGALLTTPDPPVRLRHLRRRQRDRGAL